MDLREQLLQRDEVEQICDCTTSTLYRWVRLGHFPEPIRIGIRSIRWRRAEVEHWLDQRPRASAF